MSYNRKNLKFVDSVVKDGKKFVKINEGDIESAVKRWENAVVAYFLVQDEAYNRSVLNQSIRNNSSDDSVIVYTKGAGVFVCDFQTPRFKQMFLAAGPMFYEDTKPLILKPWSRDLSLEIIMDLKSVPLWIKLPNLRMHLWSSESLSKIASVVGKPLFVGETSNQSLSYVRICVELDFHKVLLKKVTLEDDKGCIYNQEVVYEWLPPNICRHCNQLGFANSCPNIKATIPKDKNPFANSSFSTK